MPHPARPPSSPVASTAAGDEPFPGRTASGPARRAGGKRVARRKPGA
ncbi:hypothetical protein SSCG_02721 [Streptomyces clavuligerus]|nr:hypothetical protein SSCG_02721 [Streptomyces clavuligerus]